MAYRFSAAEEFVQAYIKYATYVHLTFIMAQRSIKLTKINFQKFWCVKKRSNNNKILP